MLFLFNNATTNRESYIRSKTGVNVIVLGTILLPHAYFSNQEMSTDPLQGTWRIVYSREPDLLLDMNVFSQETAIRD